MPSQTFNSDTLTIWAFLLFGIALLVFGAVYGSTTAVHSEYKPVIHGTSVNITSADVYVVDGDTIKVQNTNYRLIGFDTPETFQAKCPEEFRLGKESQLHLHRLIVEAKKLQLDVRGFDKYQRRLAVLYIDGVDIATVMIMSKKAVAYNGKTKRQSWC